jgi:hypothetical protein
VKGLREELDRVGIRGRHARRIEAELADHIGCDPSAPLGSPRLIAERFAAELRVPRTRRATFVGFGALTVTAVLLIVPQRGMSAAGGFPDLTGSRSTVSSLGGLMILLAGQVAFVAGLLAVSRFLLSRDESLLVQRRTGVALGAGALVLAGETAQAVAVRPSLPLWWFGVALGTVAVSGLGLGRAAFDLHGAAAITPPHLTQQRAFPLGLAVAIGVGVTLLMGVGSAFAEGSPVEGLTRAAIEGGAFVACFAAFGRYLGIRS